MQMREMVNRFNEQVTSEGKTEVVHEGDPDGTLFLINPDVSPYAAAPPDSLLPESPSPAFPRIPSNTVTARALVYPRSSLRWILKAMLMLWL